MKELLKVISKKLLLGSIVFNTIYSMADYAQPFILSHYGTSPLTLDKITKLTICFIISHIIMLISNKVATYIDNVNEAKTNTAIQKYYFKKVQSMTMEKLSDTHTGYIHNLIFDVSNLFMDLIWFFAISVIPLIIGGTAILIMVCKQSMITGIICLVIGTVAVCLKYKMMKNRIKYDKQVRKEKSKYNATFIDFVQNIITVRKLNINGFCNKKIDENSEEYLKITKVNEEKRSNTNIIFNSLMTLLYVVVLVSTIIMVKNGEDGLPYLLFYMSALSKIYYELNNMVRFIDMYQRFKAAKEQLDNYFKDSTKIDVIKNYNKVKLSNVVFSYTKDSVKIKIPEFILNRGDKISIMGESGQGKTTTMNILSGLFPLEKGQLRIDGKLVKNKRLDLVFVSQEVDLFDLSIRENLCLGKDIEESKIVGLLKEAGLENWYKQLPEGLDTMIGERGIKLSAGQKQRLNLIRGILIDKDVYFFDEPTSNLDVASEERIINMIEKYLKNKTYVIVTHRDRLKELCNKHYIFEDHIMKELVRV